MERRQFLTAEGRPAAWAGPSLNPTLGGVSGIRIVTKEDATVQRAQRDGTYTLNGGRFQISEGDMLPEGAVLEAAPEPEPVEEPPPPTGETLKKPGEPPEEPEARAKGAAPENRAKKGGEE